jgi:hypothetical protein
MGELRLYTPAVAGSSPVPPSSSFSDFGVVVKLVITPACHAGGRGFKSRPSRHFKKAPANLGRCFFYLDVAL